MARVNSAFLNQYPVLPYTSLRKPLVFVVDMVNGFLRIGNLHDKKMIDIIEPIQKLLEVEDIKSIFIVDEHEKGSREFGSFPPHCIVDSQENKIIDELAPYATSIVKKNCTNAFISKQFQSLLPFLDAYKDIIITGCCSDICVLQFALCFHAWLNENNKMHQRVIVPLDCIDTYHIDEQHDADKMNEFSIQLMKVNGIDIVQKITYEENV